MSEVTREPLDVESLLKQIARVVDPEAMRSAEDWYAYYREGYPDWSDDACKDKARELVNSPRRGFEQRDALAKADAILALLPVTPPKADDGAPVPAGALDVESLLKVAGEATQGEWIAVVDECGCWEVDAFEAEGVVASDDYMAEVDATFIATFNPALVTRLLEEHRRMRAALLGIDPDWFVRNGSPCAYPQCGCEPDAICHVAIKDAQAGEERCKLEAASKIVADDLIALAEDVGAQFAMSDGPCDFPCGADVCDRIGCLKDKADRARAALTKCGAP